MRHKQFTDVKYNCIFENSLEIDAAIVDLYNSGLFESLCRRYGGDNYEDLKSEVILIICELPEEKKRAMIENGYLLPYAMRVLRFQGVGYKNNKFRKDFCNTNLVFVDEITDSEDTEYDYKGDEMESKITERIQQDSLDQNNEFFYHSRLLLISLRHKNVKKTAQAIGIPYNSVRDNLKDYKKVLIEWSRSQA